MSEIHRPRRLLRRIGPVLAGLAVIIALSAATDMALRAAGIFPPLGEAMGDALLLLAAGYRSAYAITGSYLAARLAPDRPMRHALSLGFIGVILGIAGTVATWGVGSVWYPLTLIVITMPCAWAGGKIRLGQTR